MAFVAAAGGAGRAAAAGRAGSTAGTATAGKATAGKAPARRRPARRRPAPAASSRTPRDLNGLPPEEVTAELQRRRADAAKRKTEPALPDVPDAPAPEPAAKLPASPDPGGPGLLSRIDAVEPVHTGSGFVLGVLAWAVAINYLRGGVPQVRQLLRAKFLNQTGA